VKSLFFSLNYKSSPFRVDLNSSLAQFAGEWWPFRKGVYATPDWGLWVQKFLPILFFCP